jgi:hypothetical protein
MDIDVPSGSSQVPTNMLHLNAEANKLKESIQKVCILSVLFLA